MSTFDQFAGLFDPFAFSDPSFGGGGGGFDPFGGFSFGLPQLPIPSLPQLPTLPVPGFPGEMPPLPTLPTPRGRVGRVTRRGLTYGITVRAGHRRMNALNARALTRAIRRVKRFEKFARKSVKISHCVKLRKHARGSKRG